MSTVGLAELQLRRLVDALRRLLASNLAGAYLHGSLAMGSFDPARSDIDVLIVVHRRLLDSDRAQLARLLLDGSLAPFPVELSIVTTAQASLLQHPMPYEWHYSEAWRERYRDRLAEATQRPTQGDPDLVAHVLVARRRGRVLAGAASSAYLPMPTRAAIADSLWRDLDWAQQQLAATPALARYLALNAARALAWVAEDAVLSKAEGAARAARYLQGEALARITAAAAGDVAADAVLAALIQDVLERLAAIVAAGTARPTRITALHATGHLRENHPA